MTTATPDFTVTAADLAAIRARPTAIAVADAVLRIEGPGAVACVQGILTNDIEKVALPALVHGAVLTPKGMIITTLWCRRDPAGITLVVPQAGVAPLTELLARTFPPRLARVSQLGDQHTVWWLVGGAQAPAGAETLVPSGPAPFDALWLGPVEGAAALLSEAGIATGEPWQAEALRLLGGWPAVGREIDEKTLPQEVRFDELDSVKYDKGCYVGQETVARLHFRGHANRTLRALTGDTPPPHEREVTDAAGKSVGAITSLGVIGDRWVGLAKLRREVEDGAVVGIGGRTATVAALPLAVADVAP